MKVVLDTGFISSLFKINRLDLVKKLFNVKTASIPNAVLIELTDARFFKDFLSIVAPSYSGITDDRWIIVEDSKPIEVMDLGMGEREAISLALSKRTILLIDDQTAKEKAIEMRVEAFDLNMFLQACKDKGLIPQGEMEAIITALKEKDYYNFKNSVEKGLLKY
jgi:predicted nucleic acid-binding protein